MKIDENNFMIYLTILWVVGGMLYLTMISLQKNLEKSADEAQMKQRHFTKVFLWWAGISILLIGFLVFTGKLKLKNLA